MKPINDEQRKQAFTRAGFFTFIPMFLMGILVWGGMQNEAGNCEDCTEEKAKIEADLKESTNFIGIVSSLQDTVADMFEVRIALEDKYKKAFDKDSSLVAEESEALDNHDGKIESYLDAQRSKVKTKDNNQIIASLITGVKREIELKQKIRKNRIGVTKEDAEFTKLTEKFIQAQEKIDRLDNENDDFAPVIAELRMEKAQLLVDKEGLGNKNKDLQNKIDGLMNSQAEFLTTLVNKLDVECSGIKKKECYQKIIGGTKSLIEGRKASKY